MTKEEKKKINEVYDDCLNAVDDYKLSEEGGDLINKGWIEALEFVLQLGNAKLPKGFTRVRTVFKKT